MSDLAVTGDYFEEAVDEEILNGPSGSKCSGQSMSTSGVAADQTSKMLVADKQPIPGAVLGHLLNK